VIYIHIPFCRSFCTYCGFYSEIASKCRGGFSEALVAEIALRADEISDEVNTLYIGGGTPSVLPLDVYTRVTEALKDYAGAGNFDEFTFEVNPDDIVEKGHGYVEGLLKIGVNRISMGVQSFDDGILRWMNRRHDSASAIRAYRILEEVGVDNISIDLIFGLPQLSYPDWQKTLDKALEISGRGVLPSHISAYQLSVDPDSDLQRQVDSGRWTEASDELCARQYGMLCDSLRSAGYLHYEISNFARPGYQAKHNSAYWRHVPYVGIGPGAHSLLITQSPDGDSPQGHRRPTDLSVFCSKTPDPGAASDDAISITQSPDRDSLQGHRRPTDLSVFFSKTPDPGATSDDAISITQSPGGDSLQGHRRPTDLSVFCSKTPDPGAASDDAISITQSPDGDSPQGRNCQEGNCQGMGVRKVYRRQWNEPDLKAYLMNPTGSKAGEVLTNEQIGMEKIMLGLRTSAGVEEDFLFAFCGKSVVDAAVADGNLIRTGNGNLRIPEDRFFVSDSIISELV